MVVISCDTRATLLTRRLFEARQHGALAHRPRSPVTTDECLVERVKAGDRSAFRALFLAYRRQVLRLVHRYVSNEEAEDVAQEVFLHVHRSLQSFRGDSRFATWLYRLTLNVARMHVRRKKSRPKLQLSGDDDQGVLDQPCPHTPASTTECREKARALYRLLDGLSDKKRETLVLHDLESMPADEIAELLDVPVMTVRTRLFYARKELYAALAVEPAFAGLSTWITAKEEG